MALERDSHISLYEQIASQVREQIERGALPPGQRLPAEHELAARFGVSRITVQQAIRDLAGEGLLVRKQGKGTFVARPSVRFNLSSFHGFFDAVLSQTRSEARLLSLGPKRPSADEVHPLVVDRKDPPILLERLYLIDDHPIALVDCWMVPEARKIARQDARRHPSAWLLKERVGLSIARSAVDIRADAAGGRLAKSLKLSARAPVLVLTRTSFDERERCLELARFFLNSTTYQFSLSSNHPIPISTAIRPSERQARP